MKSNLDSKRPRPDAYDDLWLLLPVFLVFLALVAAFADTVPDRGPRSGHMGYRMAPLPASTASVAQELQLFADPSVPPASTAIAADATAETKEATSF